jgi:hypothetical protein
VSNTPAGGEVGLLVHFASTRGAYPWRLAYFKMCGEDANIAGRWDTWIVYGAPDVTGAQYVGTLSTPLRGVYIAEAWTFP